MRLFELMELEGGPGEMLLQATMAMGFSHPVARHGLEAELMAWRLPGALESLLAELPPDLDPVRRPRSVLIIAARTLPASTMRAVLMARLLGAEVTLKAARGQEAIARAIAAADPAVSVAPFSAQEPDAVAAAIRGADAVVVLGSDETLQTLRAMTPEDTAFVGHGHRVSVAWLDGGGDAALLALARDVCAWDQAGCLSPQVAWTTADPRALLPGLAEAFRRVEASLPMALPPEAKAARQVARTFGEMTGQVVETESALICALDTPEFRPTPGHRVLWVLPAEISALSALASKLSTVGISGRLGAALGEGVRRCALGEMQRPPLAWAHDGRPKLTPMLRPLALG